MRPVLRLAETGLLIRNLVLGTFAGAMMRRRPLAVAVPEPSQPDLLVLRDGKALQLVGFHREPDSPPLTRLQKLGSWQPVCIGFGRRRKRRGRRIQNRLYASKHSAAGAAAIQALTATGRLLKRTGAMGLVEAEYLEALGERPAAVASTTLTLATNQRPSRDLAAVLAARLPGEPVSVLDLVRTLQRSLGRVQILVRLHPKHEGTRRKGVRGELEALGTVIQHTAPPAPLDTGGFVPPEDFYQEQIKALSYAAAAINLSSTLTVDAAILHRPVIFLAYDAAPGGEFPEGRARLYAYSSHYARLVATGGVAVVGSAAECVRAVEAYLADPGRDRQGRRQIVEIVARPAEGRVGERLAAEVAALEEARE